MSAVAEQVRVAASGAAIAITKIDVTYGVGGAEPVTALSGIDLLVPDGAFVSLVGPSGCGKSTLLKVVADLMTPTRGTVTIGGSPPGELRRQGRIGLVFQQANLMPWLKVSGNIGLLRDLVGSRGGATRDAGASVDELIRIVGLTGFDTKYPHQLSGGMQQRAALARALALDPAILLMDEPFAALDAQTREVLQEELLALMERPDERKTMVFITHSIDEAIVLGDRVAVMSARPGRIKEVLDLPFGWPRDADAVRTDPRFAELRLHIWRQLHTARPRQTTAPREVA